MSDAKFFKRIAYFACRTSHKRGIEIFVEREHVSDASVNQILSGTPSGKCHKCSPSGYDVHVSCAEITSGYSQSFQFDKYTGDYSLNFATKILQTSLM